MKRAAALRSQAAAVGPDSPQDLVEQTVVEVVDRKLHWDEMRLDESVVPLESDQSTGPSFRFQNC